MSQRFLVAIGLCLLAGGCSRAPLSSPQSDSFTLSASATDTDAVAEGQARESTSPNQGVARGDVANESKPDTETGSPTESSEYAELEKALDDARRTGWTLAQTLIDGIEGRADIASLPGIRAFLIDLRYVAKEIDTSQPADTWRFDSDKLITHNPNFWRATYEIAPSDPGWLLIHASLLLAGGEARRSMLLLQAGKWTPGIPKRVLDVLFSVQHSANDALQKANSRVEKGIEKYDAGDRDDAQRVYNEILKRWPQCSIAHYETGLVALTSRVQSERAQGQLLSEENANITDSAPHFARARLHDPLQWKAYQGNDPEVIAQFMELGNRRKAVEQLQQTTGAGRSDKMPDAVLFEFADACQGAGQHELAIVTRQAIVARRGRFDPSDHPFLSKSLRALAPGPEIEAIIEVLAGAQIKFAQLIGREPEQVQRVAPDTSGFDLKSIVLYQDPNVVGERIAAESISGFINKLRAAAQEYWKTLPKQDGRNMMAIVFLKPDRKIRFWFTFPGNELDADTRDALLKILESVQPPEAKAGPVVVGLQIKLWDGMPDQKDENAGLPDWLFPQEWITLIKDTDEKLQIPISDGALRLVWPD